MLRDIACVCVALALVAPAVEAQEGAERSNLTLSMGLVSNERLSGYGGVHGGIVLGQRVPSVGEVRLEGILADGEVRGLATLGSLMVDITDSWYGVAGGGAYFDDGVNPTWMGGVGRRLPGFGGSLSIELRYLSMQDGALYWSIGRALF